MCAQTRRIVNIGLVEHNAGGLQIREKLRDGAPVGTIAVVLVNRHPVVVRLPPLVRDISLDSWVLARDLRVLGVPPRGSAESFHVRDAPATVMVLVAEVQDTAAVATALANLIWRTSGGPQEPATAFVECDSSGIDVLAGAHEAGLDSAFPVWFVVGDWRPKFGVVADTHVVS